MTAGASAQRFAFAFTPGYFIAGLGFGITSRTAFAQLDVDSVAVRFGPWHVRTPYGNVAELELTGPFSFLKTAGPARLAVTDRGLTFATNGDRGVRLGFRSPVPGIEPTGLLRHPELTVTLAEPDRFITRLRELGAGAPGDSGGW